MRLHDDVADVQPRAERNPFFRWLVRLTAVHAALHRDSAFEGIANAFETGNEAVTGVFNDLPARGRNRRFDSLFEESH